MAAFTAEQPWAGEGQGGACALPAAKRPSLPADRQDGRPGGKLRACAEQRGPRLKPCLGALVDQSVFELCHGAQHLQDEHLGGSRGVDGVDEGPEMGAFRPGGPLTTFSRWEGEWARRSMRTTDSVSPRWTRCSAAAN